MKKKYQFPLSSDDIHWGEGSLGGAGIRVLGAGNTLYYQEDSLWFMCEMSALSAVIGLSEVKKWESGAKITPDEKEKITVNVKALYRIHYGQEPKII